MFKRYWVQCDYPGASIKGMKVILKTNDREKAIKKMKREARETIVYDCLYRRLVDANYRTNLYSA